MRTRHVLGAAAALLLLLLAGCALGGTAVVTGSLSAAYFAITSDVTVTITQRDSSFSLPVPMTGGSNQQGSFILANVPTGAYAVAVTFETNNSFIAGSQYRLGGGAWIPVDGETVTGAGFPYTFSITIDSITIEDGLTFDIDFGNPG
jgi:hypothetical protein